MTPKTPQFLSTMTTRQKATAGIFAVILIFLIWQIFGMFRGGGSSTTTTPIVTSSIKPMAGGRIPPTSMQPQAPQPAQLAKPQPMMSQREADLLKLQQETEAKYISALNELQMLKIEREIAETNKAIATARLDTVTAQKGIVDLLKPAPITASTYARGLVIPVTSGATTPSTAPIPPPPAAVTAPEISYTVISVSQLQHKWNAVIGFQGNLFNVFVGDFLPPDQSKVLAIDRSGVTVDKNGLKRKISLVPII